MQEGEACATIKSLSQWTSWH